MANNDNDRLTSWKEIAKHLQVEPRTVMRWERERALPVHRVPGGKRQGVFAYRHELDAWLHGQPASLVRETAPQEDGAIAGDEQQSSKRQLRRTRLLLLLAAALILLASAVGWRILRSSHPGERKIARAGFAGNKLIAWDTTGREMWSHEFPDAFQDLNEKLWHFSHQRAQLVDCDGSGKPAVLAVLHLRQAGSPSGNVYGEMRCYSADGNLRWRYRPEAKLRFRDDEFDASWLIHDFLVTPDGPRTTVWLAVHHAMWWPGYVVKLDTAGYGEIQFVNSGQIYSLGYLQNPTGAYLLAGGVNNEPYAGMLAVLKVNQAAATSPQTPGSEFECRNCPPGKPFQYYVFPATEFKRFSNSGFNPVSDVLAGGDRLEVGTLEFYPAVHAIYDFSVSGSLRPVRFRLSDGFKLEHERFEQLGKLNHSLERCPDCTQPKMIRTWTADGGWKTISLPAPAGRVQP